MGKYQMFKDAKGEFRWRYVAANGNIIAGASEGYVAKRDCQRSIDIMKGSKDDPVEDLT